MKFELREVKENLPGGGWHTVHRIFLPHQGAQLLGCPGCGNTYQDKFKTVVEGGVLKGALCMACQWVEG